MRPRQGEKSLGCHSTERKLCGQARLGAAGKAEWLSKRDWGRHGSRPQNHPECGLDFELAARPAAQGSWARPRPTGQRPGPGIPGPGVWKGGGGAPRTGGQGGTGDHPGWEDWSCLDLQEPKPGQETWRFKGKVCSVGGAGSPPVPRGADGPCEPRREPAASWQLEPASRSERDAFGADRGCLTGDTHRASSGVLTGHGGQHGVRHGVIPGKGQTGTEHLRPDCVLSGGQEPGLSHPPPGGSPRRLNP